MGSQAINGKCITPTRLHFVLRPIVLEFPRLRDEPSFEEMLGLLSALELRPSSWSEETSATLEDTPGLSHYLTSILKNSFDWLDDSIGPGGEQKEMLWELASKRISERCGRSGT